MGTGQKRNWLERTVLVAGIILVSATLGILAYDMITFRESPPYIVLSSDKVERQGWQYALHVNATNNGTETAQDLIVEVKAGKGVKEETARLEFSYLPGKSTVNGWVTFRQDPSKRAITLRVLGYSTP